MADKKIKITVKDRIATLVGTPVIVCGNSDYTVTFTFDDEWSLTGLKTARFVYIRDGVQKYEDVVFSGDTVSVPVLSDVAFVSVGVFEGNLSTTTPARILCTRSILCGTGAAQGLTEDVYNQLLAEINELAAKGAFGATEEQMNRVKALEARMDTFTKLEEGSTTGDAELMDIRTGADGTVHDSAGEAVREQVAALNEKINAGVSQLSDEIENVKIAYNNLEKTDLSVGGNQIVKYTIIAGHTYIVENTSESGAIAISTRNTSDGDTVETIGNIKCGKSVIFNAKQNAKILDIYANAIGSFKISDISTHDNYIKNLNTIVANNAKGLMLKVDSSIIWEQGLISTDGSVSELSNHVYTQDYLSKDIKYISVCNDYKVAVAYYSNEEFISRTAFLSDNIIPIMNGEYDVKLTMMLNENSVLTSDCGLNVVCGTLPLDWSYGLISSTDNSVTSDLKFGYTENFIDSNFNKILVPSNYMTALEYFTTDGEYIGRDPVFKSGNRILDHAIFKYRVCFRKIDETNLEVADFYKINPIEAEDDIFWKNGIINTDGFTTYKNNGYYTPNFIPSSIKCITLNDLKYTFAVAVYSLDGVFISRDNIHGIKPFMNFNHETYRYKISVLSPYAETMELSETSVVEMSTSLPTQNSDVMNRMVGISDMFKFISGDGTQIAVDEKTGICYVSCNCGSETYGESYKHLQLIVFPIHQPYRAEYYDIAISGETYGNLYFTGTRDNNILNLESVIRCYFFNQNDNTWWYRDFDKLNKTFSDGNKVMFKESVLSDELDFSNDTFKNYYDKNSMVYDEIDAPATLSSNFIVKDNKIYTLLTFGCYSAVVFAYSEDGKTWVCERNLSDIIVQYEASLAYCNGWYLIGRCKGLFYSDDDFATYTQIGQHYISQGSTRPDIISCNNNILVGVSSENVFDSDSASNSRTNITFYKGSGTSIESYEQVLYLLNKHGISYYRLFNYKGVLYLFTTLGELFPEHHDNEANCKDGIYFVRIGEL